MILNLNHVTKEFLQKLHNQEDPQSQYFNESTYDFLFNLCYNYKQKYGETSLDPKRVIICKIDIIQKILAINKNFFNLPL